MIDRLNKHLSLTRQCQLLGLSRSSLYYQPAPANTEDLALMARIDRATGALRLDEAFTTPGAARPGVDFGRDTWPHGATGPAIPHGAVFSRR